MAEARKLRPISREEAEKWEINFTTTGPLRVAKAEFDGNIDYHCPECAEEAIDRAIDRYNRKHGIAPSTVLVESSVVSIPFRGWVS
jgi:hypothetical protein